MFNYCTRWTCCTWSKTAAWLPRVKNILQCTIMYNNVQKCTIMYKIWPECTKMYINAQKMHNRKFWKNFRHLNKIREGVGVIMCLCRSLIFWYPGPTLAPPPARPPRPSRPKPWPCFCVYPGLTLCSVLVIFALLWLYVCCPLFFGLLIYFLFEDSNLLFPVFFCIIRCFMFKICIFDAFYVCIANFLCRSVLFLSKYSYILYRFKHSLQIIQLRLSWSEDILII